MTRINTVYEALNHDRRNTRRRSGDLRSLFVGTYLSAIINLNRLMANLPQLFHEFPVFLVSPSPLRTNVILKKTVVGDFGRNAHRAHSRKLSILRDWWMVLLLSFKRF